MGLRQAGRCRGTLSEADRLGSFQPPTADSTRKGNRLVAGSSLFFYSRRITVLGFLEP